MLALAVVAKRGGLDDGGHADPAERDGKLVERANRGGRRDRKPVIAEKALLARTLLRHVQRGAARTHRDELGGDRGRFRGDVLEFEGDDVHALRERTDGVEIVRSPP